MSKFVDSDEDGLPDFVEEQIGTDINNEDTDGDGLTDYQEYHIFGTDPLVYDSVTEGVSDADADCDDDGLSIVENLILKQSLSTQIRITMGLQTVTK